MHSHMLLLLLLLYDDVCNNFYFSFFIEVNVGFFFSMFLQINISINDLLLSHGFFSDRVLKLTRESLLNDPYSVLLIIHFPFSIHNVGVSWSVDGSWLFRFTFLHNLFLYFNQCEWQHIHNSGLIHLLNWIGRVNDFCFVNRMENILCVFV